jgi:D-beta-D-heptose 7-phosphate kinase/D-beta-D-heptose 1-phosphate adenosyltransferase
MKNVIVIGDYIVDEYIHCDIERISPEAPILIADVDHHTFSAGGAGNVANNIESLGCHALLMTVIGDDEPITPSIRDMIKAIDASRPTTRKTRIVAQGGQQLLRIDHEVRRPISAQIEHELLQAFEAEISNAPIVVISDYMKGVVTPTLAQKVIKIAHDHEVPVIVDSKSADYSIFAGAFAVTPNEREYLELLRRGNLRWVEQIDYIVHTLGERGIDLRLKGGEQRHFKGHKVKIADVTGAGDSVVAALAAHLANNSDEIKRDPDNAIQLACLWANAAGAVAASKRGTSVVTTEEMGALLL